MITPRRALLATPFLLAAGRKPLAATPIHRLDTKWWRARHEAKLAERRAHRPNLLFLGDSITQNWEKSGPPDWQNFAPVWQRLYGGRAALNLGFSGDATSHLLWRIENGEVDDIEPKAAVILIGANNLGRLHWPAEDTLEGIAAILASLRRRLPRTHLVLLGVLPSIRSPWASETTLAINRGLAERQASTPNLTFRDLSSLFMTKGQVDAAAFYDRHLTPPEPALHPTAQAQERLALALEPILGPLLGDRPRA